MDRKSLMFIGILIVLVGIFAIKKISFNCESGIVVLVKDKSGNVIIKKCVSVKIKPPLMETKNSGIKYPNPSAMYCISLGYNYTNGKCVFPNGDECDSWEFFSGKCGKNWTYCERVLKGKIINNTKPCDVSQECSVCVFKIPLGKEFKNISCLEWDLVRGKCIINVLK